MHSVVGRSNAWKREPHLKAVRAGIRVGPETQFDRCLPTTSKSLRNVHDIGLTGGIDPAREYMFADRPGHPEMRDSVSFWVFDDRVRGKPPHCIVGGGSELAAQRVQVNGISPDGRVVRG